MPDINNNKNKKRCRHFFFQNLPKLCCVATECVSSFSMDAALQTQLYKVGIMWHLLSFLFEYDFTLEEGGVEKSGSTNQQVLPNLPNTNLLWCCRNRNRLTWHEKSPTYILPSSSTCALRRGRTARRRLFPDFV